MNSRLLKIFKKGSRTYFYTSLFFPEEVRKNVFVLYAFVRTADDFVDSIPQRKKEFNEFAIEYKKASRSGFSENEIIYSYISLEKRKKFKKGWTTAFLNAMRMDLQKRNYKTIKELEEYIFGSAQVIGFMMANILNLPKESAESAGLLGKAMQYINFLRDIEEDNMLGRNYIPQDVLEKNGFGDIEEQTALKNRIKFKKLINGEINRWRGWQSDAEKGFKYIPKRLRVPVKTASDMYIWTAQQLEKDPFIVYRKKVKPPISLIIYSILKNYLSK